MLDSEALPRSDHRNVSFNQKVEATAHVMPVSASFDTRWRNA